MKKRFLIAALCLITVLSLAFTGCQREKASSDANDKEITSSSTSDDIIYNQKELQEPKELTVSEKGTLEIEVETLAKPDNTVPDEIYNSGIVLFEVDVTGLELFYDPNVNREDNGILLDIALVYEGVISPDRL